MIPVAIVGASGYTGAELCRLLLAHPSVEIVSVHAKTSAGQALAKVFPQFRGVLDLTLEPVDADAIAARAKVAFCALPHGESAGIVTALHDRGMTVLDLSADFRLRDAAAYRTWYGHEHPAADRLAQAVYGLPERHRDALRGATLIAVPGCYPTASILALAPLLDAGLVARDGIVIDAKSGVSGAGRGATQSTHFSEIGEGIRAYKAGGTHRHTPEIEQELGGVRLTFTPHLVPMSRGILAVAYATPAKRGDVHAAMSAAYEGEPFVTVLPPGELPDTAFVRGSNRAHVNVVVDERAGRVIAMSAIDNLVKGASGQAIQCMNLALGLPETTGLMNVTPFP